MLTGLLVFNVMEARRHGSFSFVHAVGLPSG